MSLFRVILLVVVGFCALSTCLHRNPIDPRESQDDKEERKCDNRYVSNVCDPDLCKMLICPAQRKAKCTPTYCDGRCGGDFHYEGNLIDCWAVDDYDNLHFEEDGYFPDDVFTEENGNNNAEDTKTSNNNAVAPEERSSDNNSDDGGADIGPDNEDHLERRLFDDFGILQHEAVRNPKAYLKNTLGLPQMWP